MEDSHMHKCGFDLYFDPSEGCGLVWGHPDSTIDLPRTECRDAHLCPRCGKGPWTAKFDPNEDELEVIIIEV